jgi:MFS transporter, putative metabolite:H+ symporter
MIVNPGAAIGARLDRLPISRFHHKILWLIGLGMFLDTFDIYLTGGVLAAMVQEGFSDIDKNAIFISGTVVGLVIGAFLAGLLGDHLGRKFSYQFNLMIFGLASLAAAFAPNMTVLIVLRVIMGVGLGAEIVIGFGALAEFVPAKSRGRWQAGLSLINNSSFAVASLLGYWVIPHLGWRYMFGLVGVGAMIVWYMRKSLPESPRWLESRGRQAEALSVLEGIEGEIEVEQSIKLVAVVDVGPRVEPERSSIWELFKPPMLTRTFTACMIFIAMVTALYVYISWLPSIFVKQGINLSSSLGYMAVISLGGPLGSLIGILIADRFSRKWTTVVFALSSALLGYIYAVQSNIHVLVALGFLLMTSMYCYNAIGFGTYVSELFPTRLRLRGCGVTNTVGRFFTIFSPFLVVFILKNYGPKFVFFIITLIFVITALCVALWGIETRKQSLEEIESKVTG